MIVELHFRCVFVSGNDAHLKLDVEIGESSRDFLHKQLLAMVRYAEGWLPRVYPDKPVVTKIYYVKLRDDVYTDFCPDTFVFGNRKLNSLGEPVCEP